MNNKYTPGPWRLSHSTILATKGNNTAVHVARIVTGWGVNLGEEAVSNARLIAAAPELLEALESIIFDAERADSSDGCEQTEAFADLRWSILVARETIRQAKGE